MEQLIKKCTINKLLIFKTAVLFMILSLCILGNDKVYAAGGITSATVEVTIDKNVVTDAVTSVSVDWGNYYPGINLYRQNLVTMEEEDLGSVGSGGSHYYKDSLTDENGPKNGTAYMYRIGNGTDFFDYSEPVEIPDLKPTATPYFELRASDKTFKLEYKQAYTSISSTSDLVF